MRYETFCECLEHEKYKKNKNKIYESYAKMQKE
jgi:hypothetical protein